MADGSGIHSDASLAHINGPDARDVDAPVDGPICGPHDKAADARANEKYFRRSQEATAEQYEAYAEDLLKEKLGLDYDDDDSCCACGAPENYAPGIGWYCTRTGVDAKCKDPYEPKVLKQAKDPGSDLCTCGAPEKIAPGIGPYCTRTGVDMKCEATLEDARPKLRAIQEMADLAQEFGVYDLPASAFVTKDSGQREDFSTGSRRDTRTGKGRYDLLPPAALRRLAQVYERGAAKYGDRNWELGQPLSRFLDSALRHTFQVLEGKTDEDHAGQAAWNLLAFIEIQHRINEGLLPKELNDLG